MLMILSSSVATSPPSPPPPPPPPPPVAAAAAHSPTRRGAGGAHAARPKPLPNNWPLGQVAGIAVDARGHVWLIPRPKTPIDEEKAAPSNPPPAKCCWPAPPVLEF